MPGGGERRLSWGDDQSLVWHSSWCQGGLHHHHHHEEDVDHHDDLDVVDDVDPGVQWPWRSSVQCSSHSGF